MADDCWAIMNPPTSTIPGRSQPMTSARRLIVNADDFGRSTSINQAIIRAHREGVLTTASLMVNEPAFAEAVALARENPRLGIGLHLTFICGHSTLPRGEVPGLVNSASAFAVDASRAVFCCLFRRAFSERLRAECDAHVVTCCGC